VIGEIVLWSTSSYTIAIFSPLGVRPNRIGQPLERLVARRKGWASWLRVRLGHHGHGAELMEMNVECEGALDANALHDGSARAVSEAPVFIGEFLKDVPRVRKILITDPNY
jgi:hypothetical protein